MKNEILISKKIADIIVKVCFDVVEFSKLYEQKHLDGVEIVLECNEDVKKGIAWFISSQNSTDLYNNIGVYLQCVITALQFYKNLKIPIKNKDKLIIQLTNLKKHLIDLQNEVKQNFKI